MLLVADVHGAAEALGKVAGRGETVLVLGDLVNFIDYRSLDGILAEVYCGPDEPIIVFLHVASPVVRYTDRGKSAVEVI